VAPHVLEVEVFLCHQPDVDATVIVPVYQHELCVGFLPLLAWELAVDPINYVVPESFEQDSVSAPTTARISASTSSTPRPVLSTAISSTGAVFSSAYPIQSAFPSATTSMPPPFGL
jgi:hypothetical protein